MSRLVGDTWPPRGHDPTKFSFVDDGGSTSFVSELSTILSSTIYAKRAVLALVPESVGNRSERDDY
jgi:hypothetical protein